METPPSPLDQQAAIIAQMATTPKPPSLLEAIKAYPWAKNAGLATLGAALGAFAVAALSPSKQAAATPPGPVFRLEAVAPAQAPSPLPALSTRQSLSTVIVEGCQYILFTVGEPTNANFALSLSHAGACTNWQAHQALMK